MLQNSKEQWEMSNGRTSQVWGAQESRYREIMCQGVDEKALARHCDQDGETDVVGK